MIIIEYCRFPHNITGKDRLKPYEHLLTIESLKLNSNNIYLKVIEFKNRTEKSYIIFSENYHPYWGKEFFSKNIANNAVDESYFINRLSIVKNAIEETNGEETKLRKILDKKGIKYNYLEPEMCDNIEKNKYYTKLP